ncbi:MAG: glycerol-3-phosphate dehydrogenase/oxidase [bacterium]|nr:glycerol-3-phosphate dehydrogenase/oxidase [bacterium]
MNNRSEIAPPSFSLPHHLGPQYRRQAIERLKSEQFDVVVIGAGVTGTGCALDAASRGLKVALLEQRDVASGTSSRSSKLIHGGLRYLEQLDFRLVKEALRERSLLITRLAPHLVRPVKFLYPLQHRLWERAYVGAGIALYDGLAKLGGNPLPRHRHLSRRKALAEIPSLAAGTLVGGIQYYDAQVDDARHTLAVARTAAATGATVASSVRVTGLGQTNGRVTSVAATCLETGDEMEITTRHVINATGVWTDRVEAMAGNVEVDVTASKGIHLVIPRDRITGDSGIIIRTDKSVLFLIPWGRHWLVGTTDTSWNLDLAHPAASAADIEYLLRHLNSVLEKPLTKDDVEGVYAGLRPLLTGESEATSKLSREHGVWHTAPGMTTVAGGKYTTYRVMAEDTIDAAAKDLGGSIPPSATAELPLVGANGFHAMWNRRETLAAAHGLSVDQVERLLSRHGSLTTEVLTIIADQPALASAMPGSPDYLLAEAVYAVAAEGALHLDDVLTRRTRISVESWDRGIGAADVVAPLMAEILGWDDTTLKRELEHYRLRVDAERESQTMSDDQTADATRLGAPDVRRSGK